MSGRPPTPPCVPFGTRRFNEFREASLSLCSLARSCLTASLCVFLYFNAQRSVSSLGFHPTLPTTAGLCRFLLSSRCPYVPSTPSTPIVRPFPSVRIPFFQDCPPHGTMASADFSHLSYTLPHRFLSGGRDGSSVAVQGMCKTSPGKSK